MYLGQNDAFPSTSQSVLLYVNVFQSNLSREKFSYKCFLLLQASGHQAAFCFGFYAVNNPIFPLMSPKIKSFNVV